MDTYYRKTRRITASSSLKRPAQSVTPPKPAKLLATPTTPKDQRLQRPKDPPPLIKPPKDHSEQSNEVKNSTVRKLFNSVHPLDKSDIKIDVRPLDTTSTDATSTATALPATPKVDSSASTTTLPIRSPIKTTPIKASAARRLLSPHLSKNAAQSLETKRTTIPISPVKITTGPLKGVSTSLLDLIRAKEAKAKLFTPEDERRRVLISIAPNVSRIVSTIFTVNNKDIMPYDKIVEKCHRALKSNYETKTIDECLELMDKVAPEWISIVTISRGRFMKINKDKYSIPQLLEAIKKYKHKK